MGRKLLWWCLPPVLLMAMLLCVCAGSVPALSRGDPANPVAGSYGDGGRRFGGGRSSLRVRLPRGALRGADGGFPFPVRGGHAGSAAQPPGGWFHPGGFLRGFAWGLCWPLCWGCSSRACLSGNPTWSWPCFSPPGSLALSLTLAYALDRSLATGTIILIGVVFSMFVLQPDEPADHLCRGEDQVHYFLDAGASLPAAPM